MTSGSFHRSLLSRAALPVALMILTSNPIAFGKAGTNAVTVSPSSLSYGNQAINTTSAAQTATLTNNQTKALTITSLSLNLSDYAYTTTCPISPQTLAGGATCKISISFTPAVTGSRTATLVVLTDACVFFFVGIRRPPILTPFPSTTLFR